MKYYAGKSEQGFNTFIPRFPGNIFFRYSEPCQIPKIEFFSISFQSLIIFSLQFLNYKNFYRVLKVNPLSLKFLNWRLGAKFLTLTIIFAINIISLFQAFFK